MLELWGMQSTLELVEIELFICIKMDLALNNLQRLICYKAQTNKQITHCKRRRFCASPTGQTMVMIMAPNQNDQDNVRINDL